MIVLAVSENISVSVPGDTGKQSVDSEPLNVTKMALFGKSSLARDYLLASLLIDLVDNGDLQHCSTVAAVIGLDGDDNSLNGQITKKQVEIWFISYIDILHRLQLWAPAIEVIECSREPSISAMNSKNVSIESSCAECSSQLMNIPSNGGGRSQIAQSSRARQVGRGGIRCSICMQLVQGLMIVCPGCGHGGHEGHMREWFKENNQCPAGCAHNCVWTLTRCGWYFSGSLHHHVCVRVKKIILISFRLTNKIWREFRLKITKVKCKMCIV